MHPTLEWPGSASTGPVVLRGEDAQLWRVSQHCFREAEQHAVVWTLSGPQALQSRAIPCFRTARLTALCRCQTWGGRAAGKGA